jgi:hypothetical protein
MKRIIGVTCFALALVPLWPAPGHAATESTTLRPTADAWYASNPICTSLPLGCGSGATTTSYPADTLHVGATGGQEAARAYLTFSAPGLSGASLVSASLTLPVDSDAGTNAPESAAVSICLVPRGLPTPAPDTAPATDCAVSSTGSYLPGSPATVEADLSPFASRLTAGSLSLAIIPTPVTATAAPTDTWSLAFSGRQRAGSSVPAPSIALTFVPPASSPEPTEQPVLVAPLPQVPDSQPLTAPPPVAQPSVVVPRPAVIAPVRPAGRLVAASFTVKGGRYGTFWAVPLLLFLLGWAIRSVGSRDLRTLASS